MSTPEAPQATPTVKAVNPRRQQIITSLIGLAVVAGIGTTIYWYYEQGFVYTDNAQIEAPLIPLGPQNPGILREVRVNDGDQIAAGEEVANVSDESIQSRVSGIAMKVNKDIGSPYKASQPVVIMFEPKELRLIARVQEDKGLNDIFVGQKAVFTMDAFGSRTFQGKVESISQTSRNGDVVFNISDQREEQEYEIKISYDVDAYPQFLNGMSARVWLVK